MLFFFWISLDVTNLIGFVTCNGYSNFALNDVWFGMVSIPFISVVENCSLFLYYFEPRSVQLL
jgi:hypothetical protein